MKPTEMAQLGCRTAVPILFTASAASEIMAQGHPEIALSLIAGLVCIFSIWIFFGIRTRVATLAALTLWTGWLAVRGGIAEQSAMLAVIVVLSLPLILAGGGPRALYRRGWSDLV